MASDKAKAGAAESVKVDVVTTVDGVTTDRRADGTVIINRPASDDLINNANPAPAFEEGPHLNDPEVRKMKRDQLKAAGVKLSDPGLSEDMKAILREKG